MAVMASNVFCGDCQHFQHGVHDSGDKDMCHRPLVTTTHRGVTSTPVLEYCREVNAKLDCPHHSRKDALPEATSDGIGIAPLLIIFVVVIVGLPVGAVLAIMASV